MAKTKGFRCPSCKELKGDYTNNGYFQCRQCNSIWWTTFDRPVAGEKGPGKECSECGNQTLHLVAEMKKVQVFRCSTCAFSILKYT